MSCQDIRCTDGLTECDGDLGCNGFGWVTMAGRKYRKRSGAANLEKSTTKVPHQACAGTGLRVCGCLSGAESVPA